MAASAALRSLDLDQILALAGRTEHGELAPEDGAQVATLLVLERTVLRCSSCQTTFTRPLPEGVSVEKFSPSADATIAVMRFVLGMPHYRLEQAQRFVGIPVPRSLQWARCEVVADAVFPVFLLMARLAAAAGLLHVDDTKVRILSCIKENQTKKKGERTGTFTTGVVAGPILGAEGPRVALYFSGREHSGENLAKLLALRPEELGPPIRVGDAGSSNLVADAAEGAEARLPRQLVECDPVALQGHDRLLTSAV